MNTTVKVVGGFLIGAAVGAAAGILLAPESGKRTRKRLLDESKRMSDNAFDSVSKAFDSVKGSYNKKLDEYAKSGKVSIDNLKETMKV